jgi:hypothetical protein
VLLLVVGLSSVQEGISNDSFINIEVTVVVPKLSIKRIHRIAVRKI